MGGTFGLIGAGGSILTMPILIYLIGISPILATSYSFYVVGLVAFIGAIRYFKKNLFGLKEVFFFAIPSALGVFIARKFFLPLIPEILLGISKEKVLIYCFSLFMIFASISMLRKNEEIQNANYLKGFFVANLVGILVGMLGAGGGFLIIPALHKFLKLEMKKATGTSLAVISINSFVAIIGDFSNFNFIEGLLLFKIITFAIAGIVVGLKFQTFISIKNIKQIFAIFTSCIAIIMIFSTL